MQQQVIEVTKLSLILKERGLSQSDLYELIKEVNDGQAVQKYILNKIINGVQTNYTIRTAILISNALNVPIDDIVD